MERDVWHEGETLVQRSFNKAEDHEVLGHRAMSKVFRYSSEGTVWYSSDRLKNTMSHNCSERAFENVARTHRRNSEDKFSMQDFSGGHWKSLIVFAKTSSKYRAIRLSGPC